MTSTTDLIARLRDGIVVQQAGPSTLIGTPDFTATVALMREAADRLESLSTVERERDEARAERDVYRDERDALSTIVATEIDDVAGAALDEAESSLTDSQAEVARLTEALKQHERILLIAAVRRAAEIAAPLWLKAADDMSAALQQKEA